MMLFGPKSFYSKFQNASSVLGLLSILFLMPFLVLTLVGCAHNDQLLGTKKSKAVPATASAADSSSAGVAEMSPEMKRKMAEAEQLKKLQYEVYELQDRVYGNAEYGSMGLYGALRECRMGLVDKKNGGSGTLAWSEPLDRVADREPPLQLDGEASHVSPVSSMSEVFLNDRIKRFGGHKADLEKRQDDLEDKLELCRGELKHHKEMQPSSAEPTIQHDREVDTQEAL